MRLPQAPGPPRLGVRRPRRTAMLALRRHGGSMRGPGVPVADRRATAVVLEEPCGDRDAPSVGFAELIRAPAKPLPRTARAAGRMLPSDGDSCATRRLSRQGTDL